MHKSFCRIPHYTFNTFISVLICKAKARLEVHMVMWLPQTLLHITSADSARYCSENNCNQTQASASIYPLYKSIQISIIERKIHHILNNSKHTSSCCQLEFESKVRYTPLLRHHSGGGTSHTHEPIPQNFGKPPGGRGIGQRDCCLEQQKSQNGYYMPVTLAPLFKKCTEGLKMFPLQSHT